MLGTQLSSLSSLVLYCICQNLVKTVFDVSRINGAAALRLVLFSCKKGEFLERVDTGTLETAIGDYSVKKKG